jgi:hypothetical protein
LVLDVLLITAAITVSFWHHHAQTMDVIVGTDSHDVLNCTLVTKVLTPNINDMAAGGACHHFSQSVHHFILGIKALTETVLFGRLPGWFLVVVGAVGWGAWKWSHDTAEMVALLADSVTAMLEHFK